MKCEVCHRGPTQEQGGITVYRMNEMGVDGIWRCADCMTPEQRAMLDPETVRLIKILEARDI